jgi:hypothetical protein
MESLKNTPLFIDPPRFVDMSEEEQADFLSGIRARQLVAVMYYEEVQKERAANRRAALDKKFEVLEKRVRSGLDKIDAELLKMEEYFRRLNVLKLEAM